MKLKFDFDNKNVILEENVTLDLKELVTLLGNILPDFEDWGIKTEVYNSWNPIIIEKWVEPYHQEPNISPFWYTTTGDKIELTGVQGAIDIECQNDLNSGLSTDNIADSYSPNNSGTYLVD